MNCTTLSIIYYMINVVFFLSLLSMSDSSKDGFTPKQIIAAFLWPIVWVIGLYYLLFGKQR